MKVKISGRHMEVSDIAKEHISKKLESMAKYFEGIKKANVVIAPEGNGYNVEVIISAPRSNTFIGSYADKDILVAFDKVSEKMERQISRFKDKLRTKKAKHTDKQLAFSRSELRKDNEMLLKSDSMGDMWW